MSICRNGRSLMWLVGLGSLCAAARPDGHRHHPGTHAAPHRPGHRTHPPAHPAAHGDAAPHRPGHGQPPAHAHPPAHIKPPSAPALVAPAGQGRLTGPTLDLSAPQAPVIDFGAPKSGAGQAFDFGGDAAPSLAPTAGAAAAQAQQLQAGLRQLSGGHAAAAALLFEQVRLADASDELRQEGNYQLGVALADMGQTHAAQQIFAEILHAGMEHRRYRKAVEWMFTMSRRLSDPMPALALLARYRNVTFAPAFREEYSFWVAKYLFTQAADLLQQREKASALQRLQAGQAGGVDFAAAAPAVPAAQTAATASAQARAIREAIRQGLELLEQVSPRSPFYPRARYLRGLFFTLAHKDQGAVDAFIEVVRALDPRAKAGADPALREEAILSLARLHYGAKQFDRALFYYDHLSREGEHWVTGLFEATWAAYRRGDFDRALGYGVTLKAPFFADAYFPEAALVEAIIYYEGCRYAEARQRLEVFLRRYTAILAQVQAAASASPQRQALLAELLVDAGSPGAMAADTPSSDPNGVDRRVGRALIGASLGSPTVRSQRQVVADLQQQRRALVQGPLRGAPLAARLQEVLQLAEVQAQQRLAARLQEQLTGEAAALRDLLAQALRIKIEVSSSERQLLAQQDASAAAVVQAPPPSPWVDDGHLYWPFAGEYWRDELGTYEVEFSMCAQQSEAP